MPKHLWLPTNHTNNTVSFEIQTIEEGEGKALVKYVQKAFPALVMSVRLVG